MPRVTLSSNPESHAFLHSQLWQRHTDCVGITTHATAIQADIFMDSSHCSHFESSEGVQLTGYIYDAASHQGTKIQRYKNKRQNQNEQETGSPKTSIHNPIIQHTKTHYTFILNFTYNYI